METIRNKRIFITGGAGFIASYLCERLIEHNHILVYNNNNRNSLKYTGCNWQDYVIIDKTLYRPAEINILKGNFSKAREERGWDPTVNFESLVKMMVDADMERIKKNYPLPSI